MLCYVTLRYVTLRYVMLCYVMLCYVMLCYVMLCYVKLCYVMLCCRLWPVWLYHIFPHYLIKCTMFGKKLFERKMCVLIFTATLSEIFLIRGRTQRDIVINVHRFCVKYPLFLSDFINKLEFFSTDF